MNITSSESFYKDFTLSLKSLNAMCFPSIEKLTINTGISKLIKLNSKNLTTIKAQLTDLVGQKPLLIRSKKSIDGFSIKQGDIVAMILTLRKKRVFNFLDKLLFLSLPRERGWNGFSSSCFDKSGNYSFGIKSTAIFYELDPSIRATVEFGMNVTLSMKGEKKYFADMLKAIGFVFK